nr:venom-related protein CAP-superfamily [Conus ebraeus]
MVSRGHVLFVVLLPVLAQVAADDADEQMMSEVMRGDQDSVASGSGSLIRPPSNLPFIPDTPLPLPSTFLLNLLQSSNGNPRAAAAAAAARAPSEPLPGPRPESSLPSSSSSGSEYEDNEVSKRVFCNGFTGCGGRHRDRSRRQERYGKRLIPLLVKRPFCNSFGCYNGKRSLSGAGPALSTLVDPSQNYRARAIARMLAAAASARRQQQQQLLQQQEQGGLERRVLVASGALGKRLFCNGYGGCRGGKRSLFSPWMSKMSGVVADRRR